MEDFVPYELTVKLEEKGFKIKREFQYLYFNEELVKVNNYCNISPYKYAPTISQVLKWLREEKEIDLVIEPIFIYDENKRREYSIRVFAPQLNKPINCGYFNMWYDATIAGIEYLIDNNLI